MARAAWARSPGEAIELRGRVRMTGLGVLSRRVPPLISRRTTTSLDPFDLSRPDHRASGDSARPIDRVDAAGAARRDHLSHSARETPRSGPADVPKTGRKAALGGALLARDGGDRGGEGRRGAGGDRGRAIPGLAITTASEIGNAIASETAVTQALENGNGECSNLRESN